MYTVSSDHTTIGHAHDLPAAGHPGLRVQLDAALGAGQGVTVHCPEDEEFTFSELEVYRLETVLDGGEVRRTRAVAGRATLNAARDAITLQLFRGVPAGTPLIVAERTRPVRASDELRERVIDALRTPPAPPAPRARTRR